MDGRLYVPTSLILGVDEPSERTWVQNVLADPRVRVRIEGTVYELAARRVEDKVRVETLRRVLMAKYAVEDDDHARRAWIFELVAR